MIKDVVCQMDIDEHATQFKSAYQGTMYYFCSPGCRRAFNEHPAEYVHQKPSQFIDPVCGMGVEKNTAQGTSQYQGATYYFCSILCKRAFDENPEKFLAKNRMMEH